MLWDPFLYCINDSIQGNSETGNKVFVLPSKVAINSRVLIFHWRGGYLTKEVLKELLELIRKAGDEKDKTAMVSINWPQAVIRVQYTDMQVQESVIIEEANEGEK